MRLAFIRRLGAAAGLALALLGLAGCGGKSDTQLIASAKTYLAKNDTKAAIVELKSALQKNPSSGEARFLLGETLLKGGDPAAALIEFDKAHDLHYSEDDVLPPLAQAQMATGGAKKVAELYGTVTLSRPSSAADLKTTVATAYAVLGQRDRSQAAIDDALKLDPKNVGARLWQARLTAGSGKIDNALGQVAGVIADDPKSRAAWQLKGDLLWGGKRDLDGAVQAYQKCIAIAPDYLPAHSALMMLMLQRHDLNGLRAQFAELKRRFPKAIDTLYYAAELALIDRDYKQAREGVLQLLRVAPENVRVLQLAGAIEEQGGSPLLAQSYLTKALQISPSLPFASKLLAESYLRSGQPVRALAALQPLLGATQPDAESLSLAGQAELQNGDLQRSEAYFSQAAKIDPNDPKIRTALALTEISKGNTAAGFAQLESLAASDKSTFADLALISARLRSGDLDAALKAVDHLQTKQPDKPLPSQLRGRILQQRKDFTGARAAYEKALTFDSAYFPAISALAGLDVAEGKLDAALKRYENVLARDPKNYQALLAVAELRQRAGAKPAEIDKLLSDAVKLNPGEAAPRLLLIAHRLSQRETSSALTAAQDAAAVLPDNLQVLNALGQAQLAAGDTQQAISSFGKVAAAQPMNPQPQLPLADAYMKAKDTSGAARSLRKALEITPDYLPAQRGLMQLALADKHVDDALAIARTVQKQRPKEATGYLFEGEIQASQKRWDAAIAAVRTALQRAPTTEVAMRLEALYMGADRPTDAQRFADEWAREHPRDAGFLFGLGSIALARKDFAKAEAYFRRVLAIQPDNAPALNNVAWAMLQQKKTGAAALAEKANQLAPNQATILDTLAQALGAENRVVQAIEDEKKAVALRPDAPSYRLNLAKLLIQSGDHAAARTELEKLQALGDKFPGQAEVALLMKTL